MLLSGLATIYKEKVRKEERENIMKEKKSSLHFTGRRHARGGVISLVIAVVAWVVFITLCVYSSSLGGNAASVVGTLGMADAFFVLAGMFTAFKGFQERDVYYVLPAVGMALNGILFVVYFILYFMGIAIV